MFTPIPLWFFLSKQASEAYNDLSKMQKYHIDSLWCISIWICYVMPSKKLSEKIMKFRSVLPLQKLMAKRIEQTVAPCWSNNAIFFFFFTWGNLTSSGPWDEVEAIFSAAVIVYSCLAAFLLWEFTNSAFCFSPRHGNGSSV